MGQLLDTRSELFAVGVQDEQGTPATVPQKRFRKTGGDMSVNIAHGSGGYSDGQRFGDAQDYVDTVAGEGSPAAQMQAGVTGLLVAALCGEETVAEVGTGSGLYDHEAVPGAAGKPLTAWKRVGEAVGPLRQKFNDSYITSLRLEASTANKIGAVTPQLVSLDPGEVFDTDPVIDFDPDDALLHTEGETRFMLDGEVFRGTSQWAIVLNDAISARYGDSVVATDIAYALASAALEAFTIGLDEDGLAKFNEMIYGIAVPPAGTKPLRVLPGLSEFELGLRKGSQQRLTITGTPTGGTFPLTIGSRTVTGVPYNATPAQVQDKLETIVGRGRVTCSGTALPGGAVKVVFRDSQPAMTTSSASLTGGTTPTVVVTDDGYYRGFAANIPGLKLNPDVAIAGNVEGGASELALGGAIRRVTGEELITFTTRTGDSASYLA